ncbi:diguanylate cyclase [Rhodococcus sp. ARC_M5]|uniref:GGDEF domain-containing protein n=1 Tax=Rhodococcus sp. ARC_M5 TaxID=2928851 RepID=UPI001FB1C47C|nr:GGDEF domain-containing protein [Rhodococcus sp. ARC_M5]MCJ0891111.1 GGDEF domain-containing protein [Rhodococcus sp. ARC_M5]
MNSTSHRTGGSVGAMRAWFTEPFDYRWMADFLNSRPAGKLIRWVMACLTLNYGVLAVVSLLSADASRSPVAVAWKACLVVSVVAVSAAWITRPFPGRLGVVAFAVFADLGTASSLLINPLVDALLTCALFAMIGTFCTFCVSPRWLVAHLVFAVACTVVAAAATYSSGGVDTASVIFRTNVVLLAIAGVPLVSHLLITLLTDDARSSFLDPLTGLLNRRGLDAAIGDVWPRGREKDRCSAAVMIDIDRFKSVNDLYGHEEGDAVIRRVADRLRTHMGQYGVIGRTGGEEYVAVVSTSRLHIDALVHGVRRALRDPEDTVAVTVSVGAAIVLADSPAWAENTDIDLVTRATRVADSMMYEAKAAGGNRIATTEL